MTSSEGFNERALTKPARKKVDARIDAKRIVVEYEKKTATRRDFVWKEKACKERRARGGEEWKEIAEGMRHADI
jgi:hypothetical protein